MITYIDMIKELKRELEATLEKCDFNKLSSQEVVSMARRLEDEILRKN